MRSEASKESLQKVAAATTETQQAQQTASWEAVHDAANVAQAVKGARRCRERS